MRLSEEYEYWVILFLPEIEAKVGQPLLCSWVILFLPEIEAETNTFHFPYSKQLINQQEVTIQYNARSY